MTCSLCDGTGYAAIRDRAGNPARAVCLACPAGQRIATAREARGKGKRKRAAGEPQKPRPQWKRWDATIKDLA